MLQPVRAPATQSTDGYVAVYPPPDSQVSGDANRSSVVTGGDLNSLCPTDPSSRIWDVAYTDVVGAWNVSNVAGGRLAYAALNKARNATVTGRRGYRLIAPVSGRLRFSGTLIKGVGFIDGTIALVSVFALDGTTTITSQLVTLNGTNETAFSLDWNAVAGTIYCVAITLNGGGSTAQESVLAGPFSVTLVDKPASGFWRQEFKRYQVTLNDLWDNWQRTLSSGQYWRQGSGSRIVINTNATEIVLEIVRPTGATVAVTGPIGLIVDGVPYASVTSTAADNIPEFVTASGLPDGMKRVEIVLPAEEYNLGLSAYLGVYIRAIYIAANKMIEYIPPQTSGNVLVTGGDSIILGVNTVAPSLYSAQTMLRQDYPGSIASVGASNIAFYHEANSAGLRTAFVNKLKLLKPTELWLEYGTNDWGYNLWTAANFGIAYAALLDAIVAAFPSIKVYCMSPIVRQNEAVPNGLGSTLPNYRTEISNAAAARPTFCTYVDGAPIYVLADLPDGIHPSDDGKLYVAMRTALGI